MREIFPIISVSRVKCQCCKHWKPFHPDGKSAEGDRDEEIDRRCDNCLTWLGRKCPEVHTDTE